MIPESVLNQIQDRIDIVEVIQGYVPLRPSGRNFKAPCPFHHEKTPSFMVSTDKQIFHCFGCGAGGNVFGFLMKAEKKDFPEVVEMLAERTGVEIPKDKAFSPEVLKRSALFVKANQLALDFYHKTLLEHREAEKARVYLKSRGIEQGTIENFKLGYAPEAWDGFYRAAKDQCPETALEKAGLVIPRKEGGGYYDRFRKRIVFPILDAKGVCLAFGGRVMDDSLPKDLNSPETEVYSKGRHLYGVYQARKSIREKDFVIVVEGYMDLVSCHQAGVRNVVASLGTALTRDQTRLIKRNAPSALMLYDADKAGEQATLRGLELFLEEGMEVKIVRLPEGHDPDSFLKEFGKERFDEALRNSKSLFDYKLDLLKKQYGLETLEGKVKIANEMVLLFSKVQNQIQKAAWTRELASRLLIPEEALAAEMRKLGSSGSFKSLKAGESADPPSARPVREVPPLEKQMLGLMLDSADLLSVAREEVRLDDFQNPAIRRIISRIFETSVSARAAEMMNDLKDDAEAVEILSLASAEAETVQDKKKCFADCLIRIKQRRIHVKRQGLEGELAAAQASGDRNRIQQLMADFNELNKGMKKIHEEK